MPTGAHKPNRISHIFREIHYNSVAFVLDISNACLRYLSRSSQISVSCVLDIIQNYYVYNIIFQHLKDIYSDEKYENFYSAMFLLECSGKYLDSNMLFGVLLCEGETRHNCLILQRVSISFL